MSVFEPLLSCGTCNGDGWLTGLRGVISPCWCRSKPMETP